MYETTNLAIPNRAEKLFNIFLFLYPALYRKHYSEEMRFLFSDMYREELAEKGKVSLGFWAWQLMNIYNAAGGILLLPSLIMMTMDLTSRIIQSDLIHYNRPWYGYLSHTPLYFKPVIFTWVILFPVLAVTINFIPLITKPMHGKAGLFSWPHIQQNILSLMVLLAGLVFLFIVLFHDFAPCMVHGLTREGFGQFPQIISVLQ